MSVRAPGVHFSYGRYRQFRFDLDDEVVLVEGVERVRCRSCRKPVLSPRRRFYCGAECRQRFVRDILPDDWNVLRARAIKRDRGRCVICGASGKGIYADGTGPQEGGLEVDHIKPVALYPLLEFELDNLRTLCRPCHLRHGKRPTNRKTSTNRALGDFLA